MANSKFWDDQRIVDALIEVIKKGYSNVDAANKLNAEFNTQITDNAISGKVNRLKKAGVILANRSSLRSPVVPSVRDHVIQDIVDGYPVDVIKGRNGVSHFYVWTKRKELIASGIIPETSSRRIKRPPAPRIVKEPPVKQPVPPKARPEVHVSAVIIPFEAPARRQPTNIRQCEFLTGNKKPWLQCDKPTAYHTSWCNEHGKKVFVVWPPKNYQIEGQKYG